MGMLFSMTLALNYEQIAIVDIICAYTKQNLFSLCFYGEKQLKLVNTDINYKFHRFTTLQSFFYICITLNEFHALCHSFGLRISVWSKKKRNIQNGNICIQRDSNQQLLYRTDG